MQAGVASLFEQWNGKGLPNGLAREAIPRVTRIVQFTFYAAPALSHGGRDAAVQVARSGRGRAFAPAVVDAFLELARDEAFWEDIEALSSWDSVRDLESTSSPAHVDQAGLDDVAEVIADYTDLKSPYTAAHSRRVAGVTARLSQRLGMAGDEVRLLRRAALMHDVGLVAVPSYTLNRPDGERSLADQEQLRLHPHYGERILSHAPPFVDVLDAISGHHERWDGSGYYRGLSGAAIPPAARIIAVAARFDDLTHDETSGEALPPAEAIEAIAGEDGAFAPEAVAALREEYGDGMAPQPAPEGWPAGLTDREVEVLRVAAQGLTRRQIADELVVSEHTVRHHLEHVYGKTGAKTRVGAVLWAMEHDLLP